MLLACLQLACRATKPARGLLAGGGGAAMHSKSLSLNMMQGADVLPPIGTEQVAVQASESLQRSKAQNVMPKVLRWMMTVHFTHTLVVTAERSCNSAKLGHQGTAGQPGPALRPSRCVCRVQPDTRFELSKRCCFR